MNKRKILTLLVLFVISLCCFVEKTKAASVVMCLYSKEEVSDRTNKEEVAKANSNIGAAILMDGNKFYIQFTDDKLEFMINPSWETATSLNLGDSTSWYDMYYGWTHHLDRIEHPLEWRDYGSYGSYGSSKSILKEHGVCPEQIGGPEEVDESDLFDKDSKRIYLYGAKTDDGEVDDMYYLYWSIMDDYTTDEAKQLYEAANRDLCVFSNEQLIELKNILNFSLRSQKIDGITKHKFAIFTSPMIEGYNLHDIAKNIIVKYENSTCNALDENPYYDDLYAAAKDFDFFYDVNNLTHTGEKTSSCKKILGDPKDKGSFAYYLHLTFRTIQFAGPIICIVMITFEYITVVAAGSAEALKKANRHTITRVIVMLALLVLPTLIEVVLKIVGLLGDCGIK